MFALCEFRCAPGDQRWERENVIGPRNVAAFPTTSVVIRHEGRDAVLANPNHVVFYRPGERYRRALHDARGDRCIFVAFETELTAGVLAATGAAAGEIPFAHGPSPAQPYLHLQLVAQAARSGGAEALAIEEAVCDALSCAVDAGLAVHRVRRRSRAQTDAAHAELVERAKELLTERATERDSLSTIARMLHTSEFHLARVFRTKTAFSLHGYRTQLRLRAALERLSRPCDDLSALARELGFNSHSHFTGTFRSVFGLPPSRIRESCGRRGLGELRRILEAPPGAPP